MSDRLAELRRQRDLVQQHLAWLDREVAAEQARLLPAQTAANVPAVVAATPAATPVQSVTTAAAATPTSSPVVTPATAAATLPVASPGDGSTEVEAERIIAAYRSSPATLHSDIRKGCFLYFAAAFALLIALIAVLYVTLSRR